MGEWKVETVVVEEVQKHPNADTLGIVNVHGGYPVLVKLGEFKPGDLATYVPVDSLVPVEKGPFTFLAKEAKCRSYYRIKAKKLRGTFSMGLLVPAVPGSRPGDDVAESLGVLKYLPPGEQENTSQQGSLTRKAKRSETYVFTRNAYLMAGGASVGAIAVNHGVIGATLAAAFLGIAYAAVAAKRYFTTRPNYPTYDIEGIRKHKGVFEDGEEVVVTEKIHGCNASFVYFHGKLHCKSRTVFREGDSVWNAIAEKYDLKRKLAAFPGVVLYGEVYGGVQDLRYGMGDKCDFVAFDAMSLSTRKYMDFDQFHDFCGDLGVPVAPVLYTGPYGDDLLAMAEGMSLLAAFHGDENQVREGIVIKPRREQWHPAVGRKILKLAGQGYLLRVENDNNKNWQKKIAKAKVA